MCGLVVGEGLGVVGGGGLSLFGVSRTKGQPRLAARKQALNPCSGLLVLGFSSGGLANNHPVRLHHRPPSPEWHGRSGFNPTTRQHAIAPAGGGGGLSRRTWRNRAEARPTGAVPMTPLLGLGGDSPPRLAAGFGF